MSRAFFMTLFFALGLLLGTAGIARAQEIRLNGYGLRSGVVLDDDLVQILVGGQADLGLIANSIRFQPLVTIGIGDDALSLFAAAEAHYLFPVRAGAAVEPYAGGGIGVQHIDFDNDGEDTEVALSIVAGADIPAARYWGYFVEGRFVIADASIFRLEGGLNWRY